MIAIRSVREGGSEELIVAEGPDPIAGPGELVIRVRGAGVNRADLVQRAGAYKLPEDASDVLGLELSGTVTSIGHGVDPSWLGTEVVALVPSGGYATHAVVDVRLALPVPDGVDLLDAAGIIEAAATVVSNILLVGRFRRGETVLIHGAGGGVAALAIQIVAALEGRVAVTASTDAKLEHARALGAEILINYSQDNFADRMRELGGADLILDTVGGGYLSRNLDALATHGRLITIGLQGGSTDELDFAVLTKKKASVIGTLLRDRPVEDKLAILRETAERVWPLFASGRVRTCTDSVFPLAEADLAHDRMKSGKHAGKILLDCGIDA